MPAKKLTKMKRIIILLASFLFLFLFVVLSCDKSELQEQTGNKIANEHNEAVNPNTDWMDSPVQDRAVNSCNDCGSDCCLRIVLLGSSSASISLCGTTDGTGSCSASSGNCTSVSGGGQSFSLDATADSLRLVCMAPSGTVAIRNPGGTDFDLRLTPSSGGFGTNSYVSTIPASSTVFFTVSSNCSTLTRCQ